MTEVEKFYYWYSEKVKAIYLNDNEAIIRSFEKFN